MEGLEKNIKKQEKEEDLKKDEDHHDNYFNDEESSSSPLKDKKEGIYGDFLRRLSFKKKLPSFMSPVSETIDFVGEKLAKPTELKLNEPFQRKSSINLDFHKYVEREEFHIKCVTGRHLTESDIRKRKDKLSEFYQKIIVGNKNWVELMEKEDTDYFKELSMPQTPKYLVIACSDSRVVVNQFTNTDFGDVFTQRNVGNLVISTDFNVQSVIQYAIEYLKVEHVMVIGHTDCGAVKAALSNNHHGLIDHWLKYIRETAEKYIDELELEKNPPEKVIKLLIELNVREQCLNLCKNPIVQKAWNDGKDLYIHGFVFDMETGLLKDLDHLQKDWQEIQDIYRFNFTPSN
jgi:carbonic anhydrase